jgi:hypothetical protein
MAFRPTRFKGCGEILHRALIPSGPQTLGGDSEICFRAPTPQGLGKLFSGASSLAALNLATIRFGRINTRGWERVTAWDDLLREFRALGGTADNIRLGEGQYGRGLFPIIPELPIALHIPESLLIPTKDMVFEGGKLRVGPASRANARERAWLDRYQDVLGWSGGGADAIHEMYEQAAALPADLRAELMGQYFCAPWLAEPTDKLIQDRYFTARSLTYGDEAVVIPLVELANHHDGPRYDIVNGVGLQGTFKGEVCVQYSDLDAFDYFHGWGFAALRPLAFSVLMNGSIDSTPLRILPGFTGRPTSPRDWIPKLERGPNGVTLSFLMLGNERFPRHPKGIFYKLMRDAGFTGYEECFDLIQHTNRLNALGLLKQLDGVDLPLARTLRDVLLNQLRAMSFCFGIREI